VSEKSKTGRSLLILDQDIDHADELKGIAGEHGFEATIARNVDEFHRKRDNSTRIIILDLEIDSSDGIEIIRELARDACEASLIIIGNIDRRILNAAERLARARGLKVAGVLPKPVNRFGLLRLLDHAVAGRRGYKDKIVDIQLDREELQKCMDEGRIEVQYQPKIDVRTLEFVAVETLVRIRHPTHGVLEPASFLTEIEKSGLIGRMTQEVARQAIEQSANWAGEGFHLQVAINVSPLLLTDLDLPETFVSLTDEFGLDRDDVVLEITESWASQDDIAALDILTRLRMKGFHLSIDDFGTGYSTMSQLNELPYSEMKLDQSFIRNCVRDAEARAIVESSIELGHKLGMKVVAEGIEKQEDWDLISDLRCDEGQGYFIARPMKAASIPDWLSHWNASLGRV
jgi:EAL domain-containing protein (putative c-di-GMP-specific phosphodiesterase class I)/ActR/RegA family two-component response regulator